MSEKQIENILYSIIIIGALIGVYSCLGGWATFWVWLLSGTIVAANNK